MRDVAVVSFAQLPNVRSEDKRNEVEMLMPVISEAIEGVGALRGVGAPPARRPRLGAGLLLRQVLAGAAPRHHGAPARSVLRRSVVAGLDQRGRPPGPSLAGVGPRGVRDGRGGGAQPARRQGQPDGPALGGARSGHPARGALPRVPAASTRLSAVVRRRRRDDPGGRRPRPRGVRAAGVDQRARPPDRGARARGEGSDHVALDGTGGPPRRRHRRRGGRAARTVHPSGADPPGGARAGPAGDRQPVRWCTGRQRHDGGWPHPHRRGGSSDHRRQRDAQPRARHLGPLSATEPRVRDGGPLMAETCAVVGIGQTKYSATRGDVSIPGLLREAASRALEDAGCGWTDIDAVVIGKAPDMFEGVVMPELYLADALGAVGKPMMRVHTAGSVGGSTALVAASLVQAGIHRRVLTVAFEKQSESEAMWALSRPLPVAPPTLAGAGGYFAPLIRSYMRRSNAPDHVGIMVGVKDRENALRNPYAHLHIEDISFEKVADTPVLWDPIRYLETCPSSDGACAIVLSDEDFAKATPEPVAWVRGCAMRSEPTMFAGRN